MGTGSTGVACRNLNRKFIGIEMNNLYFNIAKKILKDTPNKFLLNYKYTKYKMKNTKRPIDFKTFINLLNEYNNDRPRHEELIDVINDKNSKNFLLNLPIINFFK